MGVVAQPAAASAGTAAVGGFDPLDAFPAARAAAAERLRGPQATALRGQRAAGGASTWTWTWTFDGAGGESVEIAVDPGGARLIAQERREYVRAPTPVDVGAVRLHPAEVLARLAGRLVVSMLLSTSGLPPAPRWSVELDGGGHEVIDAGAVAE